MATSPKVRVNTESTATAAITKTGDSATIVAGALSITLKKPGILSQYRIVEVVGGESSSNQTYMGMVLPLLWITAIDGVPLPAPSTKRELEALITRLGEDGTSAVMEHVYKVPAETTPLDEAVKN